MWEVSIAASTDFLPSLRARSAWRGGVGGGGWMPRRTQRPVDHRVPRARALRRDATDAEKKLWQHLRQPPFKQHHFRRASSNLLPSLRERSEWRGEGSRANARSSLRTVLRRNSRAHAGEG